ncbi:hypothetical protein MLD38_025986 [Melastoma candidum]|uniref:Uncharacterized protein n=1 Tax=Melastoma candidum TaxID=119954 RepID=A0ACB9NYI4_9MYRT|nr:hypothetical protein MLD38_025986 [Melastoma candidum]
MEASDEAKLHPFPIGPASVIGRTIALRVLFCRSMSHLRMEVSREVLNCLRSASGLLCVFLSWMHPRHPQGMLVMVTVMALLLRRWSTVKARAEVVYRRKFWRNLMRTALTYEEWAHAAKMLDRETPKMNEWDFYDVELVRNKLEELRLRRQEGSLRDIIFCMRADLIRNLGNMCNPELHKGRLQVPKLIKDYIDEVSTQLRMVCDSSSDEMSLEEKLSFLHETRHAFGRTALLLSGGASLGAFHVGVVKTLVEHKLVPRIVAGSSVGSIMCSIVATRSWPELQSFFEDSWTSLKFFDQLGGVLAIVKRVMRQGAVHEIRRLQWMLRNLTSNLTFQEAYDLTGRVLGITVCSPRKHEPPRCLNYLTSPHVVIWSAVTASCAFPGLFEAQELMAKDRSGEIIPYHPPFNLGPQESQGAPGRRWRDGSLEMDLPMMQLKELFNVNHFIVSQANPHISPFLRMKEFVRACGGRFAAKLAQLTEMEVKHRCNQILELGFPLGGLAQLFAQEWEGDVTVVMPATLAQYSKIILNPNNMELQKAANQGRRCTWEKLSAIKANCGIELALDECVTTLNHMRRLRRSAERASQSRRLASTTKFSGSRRIPSWNCIARENSTGSLEEFVATDVASRKVSPTRRGGHDGTGSDSESENVDPHSWTRYGGPLMRTNSANKFAEYIQGLNLDATFGCPAINSPGREPNSEPSMDTATNLATSEMDRMSNWSNSSLVLTGGDLLQAERTGDGILFNVVRKEGVGLQVPGPGNNAEVPECLQLECPEKDMDVCSAATECSDDEDEDGPREV